MNLISPHNSAVQQFSSSAVQQFSSSNKSLVCGILLLSSPALFSQEETAKEALKPLPTRAKTAADRLAAKRIKQLHQAKADFAKKVSKGTLKTFPKVRQHWQDKQRAKCQ